MEIPSPSLNFRPTQYTPEDPVTVTTGVTAKISTNEILKI